MNAGVLHEMKVIIKSLVLSCPESITVQQLNLDYKETEGEDIPFRRVGFDTLEDFLHSLPDTIKITGKGSQAVVNAVTSENTKHIEEMIQEQKRPRKSGRRSGRAQVRSHSKSINWRNERSFRIPTDRRKQSSCFSNKNRLNDPELTPLQILARNFQWSRTATQRFSQWGMEPLPVNAWPQFYNYQLHTQNSTPAQVWNFTNQMNPSTFARPRSSKKPGDHNVGKSRKVSAANETENLENLLESKCNIEENATTTYTNIHSTNKYKKPDFLLPTPTRLGTQENENSTATYKSVNETNESSKPPFLFPTPTQVRKQENKGPSINYPSTNGKNKFLRPAFLLPTPTNVRKQEGENIPVTFAGINRLNQISRPTFSFPTPTQVRKQKDKNCASSNCENKFIRPSFLLATSIDVKKQENENSNAIYANVNGINQISRPNFLLPTAADGETVTKSKKAVSSSTITQVKQQTRMSPLKSKHICPQSNELQNNSSKSKTTSLYEDLIDMESVMGNSPNAEQSTTIITKMSGSTSPDRSNVLNDLDEAVPKCATNGFLFCLDFPNDLIAYGDKIPTTELSKDFCVGSRLKIYVTEIHNPFKFWFHMQQDENPLDTLMHQIEQWYKRLNREEMRIPLDCQTPGQVCAAQYEGLWHRGKIVRVPIKNKVMVSFVDYGTVSEVDIGKIKYLTSYFCELPTQALRGSLSYIKPRNLHWSHEATNYFLSLVTETMVFAQISEIDDEQRAFYLVICNASGDSVVQINGALIENRFALYDPEWEECNIQKHNGKRLRHPREDFPTFIMLESGEYANLGELIYLEELGIHYEAIYDRIIYNTSSILNKNQDATPQLRELPFYLLSTNPFRIEIMLELNGIKILH
uniref:HTH OST-type domain-containing protein n=1 Tax=Glossina palpalis gambiensis TaxID=67801 RepID=A0A1B0AM32_9MUSC